MNGQLGQGGTRVSPKSQRPLETSKVAAAEIRKETLEKRDRCPSVTLSWYPASYTSLGREVSCTWLWGIPYRLRWVPMALQTTRSERESLSAGKDPLHLPTALSSYPRDVRSLQTLPTEAPKQG